MKSLMNTKVGQKIDNFFATHPKTEKAVKGSVLTAAAFFAAKNTTDAQIRDYNKTKINDGVDTSAYVVKGMDMKTSSISIDRGMLTSQNLFSGPLVQYDYLEASAKLGLGVHSRNSSKDSTFGRNMWNGIKAITPDYLFGSASFGDQNLNQSISNGDLGYKTLNIYTVGFGYEGATSTNQNPTIRDARFSYTVVQDFTNGMPSTYPVVLTASTILPASDFTFSASAGLELSKLNGKIMQSGLAYNIAAVRYLNDVLMDGYNIYAGVFNLQSGTGEENHGMAKQRQNVSGFVVGASPEFGRNRFNFSIKTNLGSLFSFEGGYTDLKDGVSINGYINKSTDPLNNKKSETGVNIRYYLPY